MLQIVKIELQSAQHLLDGVGVAIVERSIAGHTGTHLVESLVAWVALHNLVDIVFALRTRTDKCHIALQHIPQLGQFVEMMPTEKTSALGETIIIGLCQLGLAVLLAIYHHCAEFIDEERAATLAYALLSENHGSALLCLDDDVDEEEHRGCEQEQQRG